MTTKQSVPTNIFSASKRRHDGTKARAEQPNIAELLHMSESLSKTPVNWDMSYCVDVRDLEIDLNNLLSDLPYSSITKAVLTSHVLRSFTGLFKDPELCKGSNVCHTRITRYITSGIGTEIQMAGEAAFELYTLGPFTTLYGSNEYLSEEHRSYHQKVCDFGVKAHQLYATMGYESFQLRKNSTIASYFQELGNKIRKDMLAEIIN